jgi:cyclohexa-1,5-dienecarbonyl-CoA hydratase
MPARTRSRRILAERSHGGALLRVTLDAPPGNIIDIPMMEDLSRILRREGRAPSLKAILFEGAGDHFSYGVSIEDHRPERVKRMLAAFHGIFRLLARLDRVLVAAVRGQCLGGGMEIACFCHRVVAHPEARLAQPEIDLGLFAPVASLILAGRASRGVAEELCLTGRPLNGREAAEAGLVDEVADDPRRAAEEWIARSILPKSAAALGRAVSAVRLRTHRDLLEGLARVERIYLRDLMKTADAREGIEAFLARRRPVWKDR